MVLKYETLFIMNQNNNYYVFAFTKIQMKMIIKATLSVIFYYVLQKFI